jgi:hypothetical protein
VQQVPFPDDSPASFITAAERERMVQTAQAIVDRLNAKTTLDFKDAVLQQLAKERLLQLKEWRVTQASFDASLGGVRLGPPSTGSQSAVPVNGEAQDAEAYQRAAGMHRDYAKANYWMWEPGADNHLESLTCPVLIAPSDLRRLIDDEQPMNDVQKQTIRRLAQRARVTAGQCEGSQVPDLLETLKSIEGVVTPQGAVS